MYSILNIYNDSSLFAEVEVSRYFGKKMAAVHDWLGGRPGNLCRKRWCIEKSTKWALFPK
jgi:hypothetical protein